jgi:hypothetical protein
MKECTKCKKLKELTDFRKDMNGKFKRRGKCKECESQTISRKNRRAKLDTSYFNHFKTDNLINFECVPATNNSFFLLLKYKLPFKELSDLKDDLTYTITLLSSQLDIKCSFEVEFIMLNQFHRMLLNN